MKTTYRMLACIGALLALTLVAGMAAADSQALSVAAGGTQVVNMGSMDEGDLLTITWTSNVAVSGVVTGPSGFSDTISSTSFGYDILTIPHDGAYVLTLSNAGGTAATGTLDFTAIPFNPVHEATNILTWIAIIAVIIIVAIVVIVVLVIVMGGKKKKAAMATAAPQGVVMPTTPGVCPMCGSQTDTNAPFCAKCGARFR